LLGENSISVVRALRVWKALYHPNAGTADYVLVDSDGKRRGRLRRFAWDGFAPSTASFPNSEMALKRRRA